jgi:hypothetical protein
LEDYITNLFHVALWMWLLQIQDFSSLEKQLDQMTALLHRGKQLMKIAL